MGGDEGWGVTVMGEFSTTLIQPKVSGKVTYPKGSLRAFFSKFKPQLQHHRYSLIAATFLVCRCLCNCKDHAGYLHSCSFTTNILKICHFLMPAYNTGTLLMHEYGTKV